MNQHQLRISHLPYCIREVEPGWHVVLNREYKPLGMIPFQGECVDYHDHMVKFRGLGPAKAKRLSYKSSDNTKDIHLYNDGCIPTRDPIYEAAYFKRVAILYRLQIDYDAVKPKSISKYKAHTAVNMNYTPSAQQKNSPVAVGHWHMLSGLMVILNWTAHYTGRVGTYMKSHTFNNRRLRLLRTFTD